MPPRRCSMPPGCHAFGWVVAMQASFFYLSRHALAVGARYQEYIMSVARMTC